MRESGTRSSAFLPSLFGIPRITPALARIRERIAGAGGGAALCIHFDRSDFFRSGTGAFSRQFVGLPSFLAASLMLFLAARKLAFAAFGNVSVCFIGFVGGLESNRY